VALNVDLKMLWIHPNTVKRNIHLAVVEQIYREDFREFANGVFGQQRAMCLLNVRNLDLSSGAACSRRLWIAQLKLAQC
ncbi:MAG: hypothetical protein KC609_12305, partial [Myxococcales bacterium]|nr:hypothetical protein [Myxococcales bacterium]